MAITPSTLESKFESCCTRRAIPPRPEGWSFPRNLGEISNKVAKTFGLASQETVARLQRDFEELQERLSS